MSRNRTICLLLAGFAGYLLAGAASARAVTTTATMFSQIFVFGDSLSDTGNVADLVDGIIGVRYPGPDLGDVDSSLDYTDGRFTDGTDTDPAAQSYTGVWHEQLAKLFLGMTPASASLDGGSDYAYGGALTSDGQHAISESFDGFEAFTLHVDNLNRQVSDYLDDHTTDPAALYIVWAGGNDLDDDDSATNVTAAAANETAVVRRLAEAGARIFLLPNLPPLGDTPEHQGVNAPTLNAAVTSFCTQYDADLDALVPILAAENITITMYRLDINTLFNNLIADDGIDYGFLNVTDESQGASVKPDTYLFWDGLHPTTAGHYQIAAEAFTLLTGTPVIMVSEASKHVDHAAGESDAFLLTRTGTDLSAKLDLSYKVKGDAVSGVDYSAALEGKKMKPGKRTVQIPILPLAPAAGEGSVTVKLKLEVGDGYVLPVLPTGKISLDPTE